MAVSVISSLAALPAGYRVTLPALRVAQKFTLPTEPGLVNISVWMLTAGWMSFSAAVTDGMAIDLTSTTVVWVQVPAAQWFQLPRMDSGNFCVASDAVNNEVMRLVVSRADGLIR